MTSKSTIFEKPGMQLLLICGLCLVSVLAFTLIGGFIMLVFFGMDIYDFYDYSNPNTINALKLFQLLSSVGLFIVPPIVYMLIVRKSIFKGLSLNKTGVVSGWFVVVVLMFVCTPFLSLVVELNEKLQMPGFLAELEIWMKASEESAAELTKAFLSYKGVGNLLFTLLVVAVVPGIGEELLFRGVLQKTFINWTKNPHWGIWIAAILFSALHMQFYGFIPRMLLGALFGYLFYWSGSLWLPILGHFINNGSVVVLSYFYPEMIENAEVSLFAEESNQLFSQLFSLLLTAALLFAFYKTNYRQKTNL